MKKIFAVAFAILFSAISLSCQEGKSIYDYEFGGLRKNHLMYKDKPGYEISEGPADDIQKKCGYNKRYTVMCEPISIIYLKNWKGETLASVIIFKKTDLHPLGAYIGRSKEELLKEFPLGDNDIDSEKATFFKSDKKHRIEVGAIYVDGIVDGFTILNCEYVDKFHKVMDSNGAKAD
ncbi:MAG: hypothetical protein J6X95_09115 [Treponema sp.]|nr:hypothetical protein [Treponema sp.]